MMGRWYGDNPTQGDRQLELTDFSADGTYTAEFRIERGGCLIVGSETGVWGMSGPIYFTIAHGYVRGGEFSAADPRQASVYNAYEVTQLDDSTLRYRCAICGEEWTVRRVSETFTCPTSRLPPCSNYGPETAARYLSHQYPEVCRREAPSSGTGP